MSEEEVARMEAALTEHYGEPVRPVSRYCQQLMLYAEGLNHAIENDTGQGGCGPFHSVEAATTVRDGLRLLAQWRWKSNLLGRLIYLNEPLRAEPCPVHKGRWSGCQWENPCECQSGYDVTGWLPVGSPRDTGVKGGGER